MEIRLAMGIAVLFAAGAVIIGLAALWRPRKTDQLWRLYGTELAIVGFVVVASTHWLALMVAAVILSIRAQFELLDLFGAARPRWRLAVDLATGVGVVAGGLWITDLWMLVAAALLITSLAGLAARGGGGWLSGPGAILYPVVPIACFGLIAGLGQGPSWLLFLFIVVETNDAFAVVFGKILGRHPAFPSLSPGKTIEGLLAGMVIGGGIGLVLGVAVLGMAPGVAAGAVAVILIAAIAGDLFASILKRRRGVKDFAALHRLHGGALDIYDSFIFAAPFFYLYHRFVMG